MDTTVQHGNLLLDTAQKIMYEYKYLGGILITILKNRNQ